MPPRNVALLIPLMIVALASFGAWRITRPHYTHGDPGEGEVAVVTTVPRPASREAAETLLKPCLGRTVRDVVQMLDLGGAKQSWVDEPPGVLRGSAYYTADEQRVVLYIAEGEPLFRQFNEFCKWDYAAFLGCRVGGIQYWSGEIDLDLGPAVPWQWRRN
jgi:hypothetical protein